jgi:gas vesicle protein
MSKTSDITMAFLLGAITGGALALLMAPDKGEVTRGKIRRGATDLYGKGRDMVARGQKTVVDTASDVTDRARERASEVVQGARQQLDAVKEAVSEGKEAYRRQIERS